MKLIQHSVAADTTTLHKAGTAQYGRPDLVPVGTNQDNLLKAQGLVRMGVPKSYTDVNKRIEYPPRQQPMQPEPMVTKRPTTVFKPKGK